MSIVIGIQARSGSTRLAQKSLQTIGGKTILGHCVESCRDMNVPVYVLPPCGDEAMLNHCRKQNYLVHLTTATENDVLARYVSLQQATQAVRVVRITGDCPFPFVPLLDWMMRLAIRYEFTTNAWPPRTIPDGWDVEIMSPAMLVWLDKHSTLPEREHVTPAAYRSEKDLQQSGMKVAMVRYPLDLSDIKISVDTQDELTRIREMYVCQK